MIDWVNKYSCFILVLVVGFVFYVTNTYIPFFSDDIWMAQYSGPDDTFIGKISYLCEFAWEFWNTFNGRILNQVLWKVLCMAGENIFDIFNACLFLVNIFIIVKLSSNNYLRPLPYVIVVLYELYLVPNSESLYYWAAGSLNYLFPGVLAAGFLLILRWLTDISKISYGLLFIICLYSFGAGFTHEVYSLPISFALFIVMIFKRVKVNKMLFLPIFCYWIGTLFVVLAPGTIIRILGTQGGGDNFSIFAILQNKILQSFKIFNYGRLFYLLLGILLFKLLFKKNSFISFVKRYCFLLLCTFSSLAIVVLMGVGGRAVCGVEFFSLLIIISYFSIELESKKYDHISLFFLIVMMLHQMFLLPYVRDSWSTYKEMVAKLNINKDTNTVGMKDWKVDNILVNSFVAHPYKMMREDMWMKIPLKCEVCREDVYSSLYRKENREFGNIGDDFILPNSESLMQAIKSKQVYMRLEPVSMESEGNFLFKFWHVIVQKYIPSRYPIEILVNEENVTELIVESNHFLRFESPYVPVPRKIISVYKK